MTRTSLLLTALLVVSAATAGLSGAAASGTGTAASAASTYQAQADGTTEVAVSSDDVFWQGQLLRFTAGEDNASEVWTVRRVEDGEPGSLVTEVLLNGTGSAVFATGNIDGQAVVVDDEDRPVVFENGQAQRVGNVSEASFEVSAQTLNASFEDGTVRNDDHPDARTDLHLQSNRADYGVSLFSDELTASELADVFPAAEARDDRAVVSRNVSGDELLDANFTGVEAGTYNVTVVTTDGTAEDTASITVAEPVDGSAALSNDTFPEERGDVVEFNVTFDGTDTATVDIGSADLGYHSRFTVVDEDDDGVVTVRLDTYRAGRSADAPGISVVGEDDLTDAELLTEPLSDRLDVAAYPIEVSVGATRTAVGSIQLTEPSTDGIQVWTAPEDASVGNVAQIQEVATQDDDVAYQDWAIVQVEASGLYAYVQNRSDLNNNTTGVSTSLTRGGEMNVPSENVSLDRAELHVDDDGNQFFLVFPTNALNEGATYRASFNLSEANPYVSEGNVTSLSTNFSVVERNVTFDEPIEVPASDDATISGSSSVAPGTELDFEASNTEDQPFLERANATVGEDGTWEASFDFSDVPPGTNFTVESLDPEANATGTVVEDGAQAGDAEAEDIETTPAEETTVEDDAETTPEDDATETTPADEEDDAAGAADEADGDADDAADADDADGETTADEIDVDEGGTTTAAATTDGDVEAASAPASGFGPAALVGALVVLVAAGMLAYRRR